MKKTQSANAEIASYAHVLGLEHDRGRVALGDEGCEIWTWPAQRNGSRYDRWVVFQVFTDGSVSVHLNASESGFKARCLQLRRMVNDC